jgi:hypothetical protein
VPPIKVRLGVLLILVAVSVACVSRDPFPAMCEAALHIVASTAEARSGVDALSIDGQAGAAKEHAMRARDEVSAARRLLDDVRDEASRGGPTWHGLTAASNDVVEAIDQLDAGDAVNATASLDSATAYLTAVSPPLPGPCIS